MSPVYFIWHSASITIGISIICQRHIRLTAQLPITRMVPLFPQYVQSYILKAKVLYSKNALVKMNIIFSKTYYRMFLAVNFILWKTWFKRKLLKMVIVLCCIQIYTICLKLKKIPKHSNWWIFSERITFAFSRS